MMFLIGLVPVLVPVLLLLAFVLMLDLFVWKRP